MSNSPIISSRNPSLLIGSQHKLFVVEDILGANEYLTSKWLVLLLFTFLILNVNRL